MKIMDILINQEIMINCISENHLKGNKVEI